GRSARTRARTGRLGRFLNGAPPGFAAFRFERWPSRRGRLMVPNRVRLADRLGNSGAIRLFRAPLLAVLLIAACTPIAQSGPTPTATPLAIPSATSLTSSTPTPPPSP